MRRPPAIRSTFATPRLAGVRRIRHAGASLALALALTGSDAWSSWAWIVTPTATVVGSLVALAPGAVTDLETLSLGAHAPAGHVRHSAAPSAPSAPSNEWLADLDDESPSSQRLAAHALSARPLAIPTAPERFARLAPAPGESPKSPEARALHAARAPPSSPPLRFD